MMAEGTPNSTSYSSSSANNSPPARRNGARVRMTNPCDGCALRRVRCEGGRPCKDCQKRCLPCTFLRISKKRGPKGPRQTTSDKIRALQRDLSEKRAEMEAGLGSQQRLDSPTASCEGTGTVRDSWSTTSNHPPDSHERIHALKYGIWHTYPRPIEGPLPKRTVKSMDSYRRFLQVFRDRLYSVWPVLSHENLLARMAHDREDYDTWALAASVCACVIGQLRLPEHQHPEASSPKAPAASPRARARAPAVTSHDFAGDATHFRELYQFRERPTVSSLLTSFFLHVYCANTELLGTAAFHLRESLTQAHMLGLHRPSSYASLSPDERELRLRVYWVLFVSERTFCIQRGLPTVLRPIRLRPSPDESPDGCSGSPIQSFLRLTDLFTFLDGDLIDPSAAAETSLDVVSPTSAPDSSMTNANHTEVEHDEIRSKIMYLQSRLASTEKGIGLDETQRVDISVTRNWIRILLWEYTIRHFPMSCAGGDQAFSMLLPAKVSHEMLGLFSVVSGKSICAHGYGMELKVFRIADSLLDIVACGGPRGQAGPMLVGSRETLHSLEEILFTVGGSESVFLTKLRGRMAEVELHVPHATAWLQQPWLGGKETHAPVRGRTGVCRRTQRKEQPVQEMQYMENEIALDNGPVIDPMLALPMKETTLDELTETLEGVYDFCASDRGWQDVSEVSSRAVLQL